MGRQVCAMGVRARAMDDRARKMEGRARQMEGRAREMEGGALAMVCQACEIVVRARKMCVRARAGIVRASALIDRACAMSRREREMNGPRSMCVVRANSSIQGGCVGEGRNFDRVGHLWSPRRRRPRRVNRQGAENAKEGRRLFSLAFSCLVWVAVSS